AAAAIHALDHHVERMADDHDAARRFAAAVAERAPGSVDPSAVETNIVIVDAGADRAARLVEAALAKGIGLSPLGSRRVRAITHHDVTMEQSAHAGGV